MDSNQEIERRFGKGKAAVAKDKKFKPKVHQKAKKDNPISLKKNAKFDLDLEDDFNLLGDQGIVSSDDERERKAKKKNKETKKQDESLHTPDPDQGKKPKTKLPVQTIDKTEAKADLRKPKSARDKSERPSDKQFETFSPPLDKKLKQSKSPRPETSKKDALSPDEDKATSVFEKVG